MSRPVGSKGRAPKRPNGTGTITKQGYARVYSEQKVKNAHRVVMEVHLGRKLLPFEYVHHKNENRLDNRVENLVVLTPGEHVREHARMRRARKAQAS